MASIKRGDTWPPLRGKAEDEKGLLPLVDAAFTKVLFKSGILLVQGTVAVINPPDADGYNWRYTWKAGDTSVAGDYSVELEVHWNEAATPPQVETVPNGDNPTLTIKADLG